MKALLGSALSLLLSLLLVQLPVCSCAQSAPKGPCRQSLTRMIKQMITVKNLAALSTEEHGMDFEIDLPSLPLVPDRADQISSLKLDSTLPRILSGLQSFQLHFDWHIHWQSQSDTVSPNTRMLSQNLRSLSLLLQEQMEDPPSQQPPLSLPTLQSFWDRKWAYVEIRQKLFLFCDWSIRALRVLRHQVPQ